MNKPNKLEKCKMKPEEAIETLKREALIKECLIENKNTFIRSCEVDDDEFDDDKERAEYSLAGYVKEKEVLEMAISALEEVQKYREIGTVEECREAVEKQKAKRPKNINYNYSYFKCPNCGEAIYSTDFGSHRYCLNCGQAIDWTDD